MKFLGCVKAGPLAITRAGANPGAHALVKKTAAPAAPEAQTLETPEMSTADAAKAANALIAKTVLWNDVTKAHYGALAEDAQVAFLEKTAAEQNQIAADAKKTVDDAAAATAAAAAGQTATEKSIGDVRAENDVLKDRLDTLELEKRADSEFKGYPGGSAAVIPLLKTAAKLPPAERTTFEGALKAQAAAALATGTTVAKRHENSQAAAATTELNAAVDKIMEADPLKKRTDVIAEVTKARPDLMMAGLAAERAQAAAVDQ